MKFIENEVNASMAYVEQQRKRREEKTTRPSRLPIKPSVNRITHSQSVVTIASII